MEILHSSILSVLTLAFAANAQVVRETVDYQQGGTPLEGYIAYDKSIKGPRPGIVVVHEWNGLGDYVKMRADELARLGYVAFAADIYGKGVRPTTSQEMGAQATKYRNDIPLMRARVRAALDELLKRTDLVDPEKVAAIGYCFGGGVALELARSGAPLAGVVSFHGNLNTPNPADAKNIKGKVLALQGGSDPVTRDKIPAFEDEMTNAGVDWQMNIYGGAVHGFTNPNNGNDPSRGVAYNENADRRSWEAMKQFFDEIFK